RAGVDARLGADGQHRRRGEPRPRSHERDLPGGAPPESRARAAAHLRTGRDGARVVHAADVGMSIILAIEPDRRQAAHVAAIVRHRVRAELILADTTERALDAIGSQGPHLVLVPALLSPQDDAALNAALRVIAAAAHVRTLTIPVFANNIESAERGGLLSRWRRGRSSEPPTPNGCDPAVFAEQILEYLREAAAERAAVVDRQAYDPAPRADHELVAQAAPPLEAPATDLAPVAKIAAAEPITEFELAPAPAPADEYTPEPTLAPRP